MKNISTEEFNKIFFDINQKEDRNFKCPKPIIFDFYADWCGPCKAITPILESLNKDIEIIKINIDNEDKLSNFFKIRSIPALLFVPANSNLSESKMEIGMKSKEAMNKHVKEYFNI